MYPDVELSFKGVEIPKKVLKGLWKTFKPKKKMPNIKGYNVTKEEFFKICETNDAALLKAGIDPASGVVFEYGKKRIDLAAFVTCGDKSGDYYIFRRKDSPRTIEYDLQHELAHIYRGDVEKLNKEILQRGKEMRTE